jgi:hypothetical protein
MSVVLRFSECHRIDSYTQSVAIVCPQRSARRFARHDPLSQVGQWGGDGGERRYTEIRTEDVIEAHDAHISRDLAAHPHDLDRDQRALGAAAPFEEPLRELRSLAQLRDRDIDRARPGVESRCRYPLEIPAIGRHSQLTAISDVAIRRK